MVATLKLFILINTKYKAMLSKAHQKGVRISKALKCAKKDYSCLFSLERTYGNSQMQ